MKIAVDVMGGDFAPRAPIEGVKLAYEELGELLDVYLVGNKEVIKKFSILLLAFSAFIESGTPSNPNPS